MINSQAEFLMEVTDKTKADIKVHLLTACLFTLINLISREELSLITKDPSVCLKSRKYRRSMWRISSLASTKLIFRLRYSPSSPRAVRKFKIFNTNNLWINLKGNYFILSLF